MTVEEIVRILIEKGLTVTTMESCTGGLIASLITDNEGSSAIFKGGFVTYSNEMKIKCGVPKETIKNYGVYSRETAYAMALAAKKKCDADIAIGVTGTFSNVDQANPEGKPAKVFYCIAAGKSAYHETLTIPKCPTRSACKLYVARILTAPAIFDM